jgi:hypothetical protein
MKYYLIDEIVLNDMERLSAFLKDNAVMSGLDKVFWVRMPEKYFNETQSSHVNCQPYYFAVELGVGMIKGEFYIRTLKDFNCSCSGYADYAQTQYIIRFMDEMISELKIRT